MITIYSLNDLFKKKENNNIDILIYGSCAEKLFPKNNNHAIDENYVNSGDTTFSPIFNNFFIRLYRSEELIKVLIHEIIHTTGYDMISGSAPQHDFKVFNTKTNSNRLLLNETITETLAEFINCVLYSIIHNQEFNETLETEIHFGLIQTVKILNYFGFNSIDDFIKKYQNDKRKILQHTSVFEYHILKTILLYKFDEFIKIIKNKGTSSNIMKLIVNTMNLDMNYKNKIDNIFKNLNELDKMTRETFRMTKIEIYNVNNIPTKNNMNGGNYIDYKKKYYKYKNKYFDIKLLLN